MMAKITIDGKEYRVLETLPFHGIGKPTKAVIVDGYERIAVKEHGTWRLWGPSDRIAPATRPGAQ